MNDFKSRIAKYTRSQALPGNQNRSRRWASPRGVSGKSFVVFRRLLAFPLLRLLITLDILLSSWFKLNVGTNARRSRVAGRHFLTRRLFRRVLGVKITKKWLAEWRNWQTHGT